MSVSKKGMSRRNFLHTLAAGGAGAVMVAAGVPVVSASSSFATKPSVKARAQDTEVTLVSGMWAFWDPLPEEEPEAGWSGYQKALIAFYDANPNIRIEQIDVNVWDAAALRTNIAGGTAPYWYMSGVLGNWSTAGTLSAFKQGLFGDFTEAYLAHDVDAGLAEFTTKINRAKSFVDGRFYGVPYEIAIGNGIAYRRDLLAAAGLEEPSFDWTWDTAEEMAKAMTTEFRKGIAVQGTGLGWMLGAEGLGWENLFAHLPAPETSWNWKKDYTSNPLYESTVQRFRKMMYEDETVLTDVTQNDSSVTEALYNEVAAMATIPLQFVTRVGSPWPQQLAKDLGQTLDETVGFLPHPRGLNGYSLSQPSVQPLSISPDLTDAEKDAFIRLYKWLTIDEGFEIWRRADYELSGDIQQAFSVWPFVRAKETIDGIDGTPQDAWGSFVETVDYLANIAGMPESGEYIPAEENVGPTGDAWDGAQSTLMYDSGDLDIMAVLAEAENTWNSQAADFESSVSDDVFVTAASAYYQDLGAYWQEKFPDFYDNTFKGWYETVVVPALS